MWCRGCQQDVPGVSVPAHTGEARCARCGGVLRGVSGVAKGDAGSTNPAATDDFAEVAALEQQSAECDPLEPLPDFWEDDWELADDLRETELLVQDLDQRFPASVGERRVDRPKSDVEGQPIARSTQHDAQDEERASHRYQGWSWISLSLGLMALACGGVLVAWALAADRPDLGRTGLPLALAGLAGLLFGLLLQLESLGHALRGTRAELQRVEEQVRDLQAAREAFASGESLHRPAAASLRQLRRP